MTDATTPEADRVRDFVASYQEREYRRLAGEMGLGNDPRAAFEKLTGARDASPGDFEHPALRRAMLVTFDLMQRELDALDMQRLPSPWLATLASGDVNARIIEEARTRTKVMFFEHGLFRYFFDIAKLTAWVAPPLSVAQLGDDEALARLRPSHMMPPQATAYFAGTLFAYAASGTPMATASPIPEPAHNQKLAIVLLNHMERFVMAHEIAHLVRGHLDEEPAPRQEFEADASSLMLVTLLSEQRHGSWAIGYWASELALVAMNFLYRAVGLVEFGAVRLAWASKTHPDPLARREALRGIWLEPRMPPAGVLAARGVCGMTEALFQRLWEFAAAALVLEHQRGTRAAASWKNIASYIQPSEAPT